MRFGGEQMRSTSDWSSQGGRLPRYVLPRTDGATAVVRFDLGTRLTRASVTDKLDRKQPKGSAN